jgi:hypothetical protein
MRNPLNIGIIPHRARRAAAIAAAQAIRFLENLGVCLEKLLVQVLRLSSH